MYLKEDMEWMQYATSNAPVWLQLADFLWIRNSIELLLCLLKCERLLIVFRTNHFSFTFIDVVFITKILSFDTIIKINISL